MSADTPTFPAYVATLVRPDGSVVTVGGATIADALAALIDAVRQEEAQRSAKEPT